MILVGCLVLEAKEKEIYESQRHKVSSQIGMYQLWTQCSWLY